MVVRNYNDWYLAHKEALAKKIETQDHTAGEMLTSEIVRYSHLKNHLLAEDHEATDIIIACDDDGQPDEFADILIRDYFASHPEINLLYADECLLLRTVSHNSSGTSFQLPPSGTWLILV